jgi:ribosomal protein S18 acetylase RimI-like enzyme
VKLRVLRRDHIGIAVTAMLFVLFLGAVNSFWPKAFGVVIAIGGTFGALMVLYEVLLTKRIAQAEFIRDLQSGFTSDQNIGELWRKLLLNEQVTAGDRSLISSYLTFFETLHLLLDKGALELSLTDDLFRNRFFTAIGNLGILDAALIKEAGAFNNIHDLINIWHNYLLQKGLPIHPGYYSYIRALTEAKGYQIVALDEHGMADLEALQSGVIAGLGDRDWLRENPVEMLKESLATQTVLGVRRGESLVAVAVLYDGGASDESIRKYFTNDTQKLASSINLKLVMALPEHRKRGLSRTLIELLEQHAIEQGKSEILCTIHPKNSPSRALFQLLGYGRIGQVNTKYGKRLVYGRTFPQSTKRWAR